MTSVLHLTYSTLLYSSIGDEINIQVVIIHLRICTIPLWLDIYHIIYYIFMHCSRIFYLLFSDVTDLLRKPKIKDKGS